MSYRSASPSSRRTRLARVITSGDSVKARNAGREGAVAALCSVDRARWLTLSGPVRVERDARADQGRRTALCRPATGSRGSTRSGSS